MDECLPLDSLDAATLRLLLTQERNRREALEQEVARLRAGLARQNQIIMRLEQRDAEREQELATHRTLLAGLTEQAGAGQSLGGSCGRAVPTVWRTAQRWLDPTSHSGH
jgi:hypothetical protein